MIVSHITIPSAETNTNDLILSWILMHTRAFVSIGVAIMTHGLFRIHCPNNWTWYFTRLCLWVEADSSQIVQLWWQFCFACLFGNFFWVCFIITELGYFDLQVMLLLILRSSRIMLLLPVRNFFLSQILLKIPRTYIFRRLLIAESESFTFKHRWIIWILFMNSIFWT